MPQCRAATGETPATRAADKEGDDPSDEAPPAPQHGFNNARCLSARSQFECRIRVLGGVIRYPIDGKALPRLTNDWKNTVAYHLLNWLGDQHGAFRRGRRTGIHGRQHERLYPSPTAAAGHDPGRNSPIHLGITVGTVNRWENGRFPTQQAGAIDDSRLRAAPWRYGAIRERRPSSDKPIHSGRRRPPPGPRTRMTMLAGGRVDW